MRRALGLVGVVLLGAGGVAGAREVPELLSRMDLFEVGSVTLEGARYLVRSEVEARLDLAPGASVWDDLAALEERLAGHVLVESVRVRRKLPGTLVVQIEEREPVALVPTPTLEPVDARGKPLPIDPAVHRLDLPVLRPMVGPGSDGAPRPGQVRAMAEELHRLAQLDPEFVRAVSELEWRDRGVVLARVAEPAFELRFRPPLAAQRLRQGLAVLEDAATRVSGAGPAIVDLRFADQVVVELAPLDRSTQGAP